MNKQYKDYVKGDKVTVIKEDNDFIWYVSQFDMFPHRMLKDIFYDRHEPITICDTAPYPSCNGANGCSTCEHEPIE